MDGFVKRGTPELLTFSLKGSVSLLFGFCRALSLRLAGVPRLDGRLLSESPEGLSR